MTPQSLRGRGPKLMTAMVFVLAVSAFVTMGSAAAATQHWASASPIPSGTQSFSGSAVGHILIQWEGPPYQFTCSSLTSSGSVENPSEEEESATMTTSSLAFGNCLVSGHETSCYIKNGTIPFQALTSRVYQEAGDDLIEFKPASGGSILATMEIENYPGKSCALLSAGTHYLTGSFSAKEQSSNHLLIQPSNTHISMQGYPLTISNEFDLVASSGKRLIVSGSPRSLVPRWYYEWSNVAAGSSNPFWSTGSASLDFKGSYFGVAFEINCEGPFNGISGTFENPAGGGAGVSNAKLTLGNCTMPPVAKNVCSVVATEASAPLTGTATEIGGVPSVEFATSGGGNIITFVVSKAEGATKCNLFGNYEVKGKLVASSKGGGYFALSGSELTIDSEPATASGGSALHNLAGETLGLRE
jgi:hypothetical protein